MHYADLTRGLLWGKCDSLTNDYSQATPCCCWHDFLLHATEMCPNVDFFFLTLPCFPCCLSHAASQSYWKALWGATGGGVSLHFHAFLRAPLCFRANTFASCVWDPLIPNFSIQDPSASPHPQPALISLLPCVDYLCCCPSPLTPPTPSCAHSQENAHIYNLRSPLLPALLSLPSSLK